MIPQCYRELQECILVPSGAYQSLTRFRCATLVCNSTGTCPLLVLTKGRRPQPTHLSPARHSPTQPDNNPASCCLLHRTKSCLHYNFFLPFLIVGHLVLFLHFGKSFRGYFALQKNNYLISLIPNYYAQAYLRKRIRFSLLFFFLGGCTSEQGMNSM